MNEAQEDFLQKNTGYCVPLHMRLTPQACTDIRNRSAGFDTCEAGPPPQCAGCAGLVSQNNVTVTPCTKPKERAVYRPLISAPIEECSPTKEHSYDAIAEQCDLGYSTVWAVCKVLKKGKIPHTTNEKKVAEVLKGWGISVHGIVKKAPANNWPKEPKVAAQTSVEQARPKSVVSPLEEPEALEPPADTSKVVLAHNPRVFDLSRVPLEFLLGEVYRRLPRTDITLRYIV